MGKLNNDMKRFKREPKGQKEKFNEELLYELYKEKPFDNFQEFRGFILKHHGVYASTRLITRITNYQIKKYGCMKTSGSSLIPIYYGQRKSSRRRQRERMNRQNNDSTKKFLNRTNKGRYSDGHKKFDKRWTNEQKAKKNSKEPERNPYFMADYCILKNKIDHQGIGGKKAYFDRTNITLKEILEKATFQHNIACLNFISRRPDLFKERGIEGNPTYESNLMNWARDIAFKRKYHYVKIWNTNPGIYPEYTYLGYVICSDEIKMAYHVGTEGSK